MNHEEQLLDHCLTRIEAKTGWGPAAEWTTQDFTELSDRVAEATGVHLSPTTLKRVWGRVSYNSKPSPTTLEALAVFAGYANWRDLRLAAKPTPEPPAPGPAQPVAGKPPPAPARHYLYYLLSLAALAVFLTLHYTTSTAPAAAPTTAAPLNPNDFSFDFRPVTSGVPNSVVFTYDASAAPPGDTVYLQQSWDRRHRFAIPRDKNIFTSSYYLPGFFRAKLVIGDEVVQEREVYIRSEGWVALANHQPVPVYLPLEKVKREGRFSVSTDLLLSMNVALQPDPPAVTFTHVGALTGLYTDDFTFRTRLRHDYGAGTSVCQHARVLLLLKNDAIIIPLSRIGCAAELSLVAGGRGFDGRTTDLSAFGAVTKDQWIDLACTGNGSLLTFSVNGRQVFTVESQEDPREFVGIRYEFSGTGSIDRLAFSNGAGSVWEEDF